MGLAAYYVYQFQWAEDKSALLIGATTHGHYQIEMACSTCHVEPFGGRKVIQNACVQCHGKELELAHDSHPKSKFTDPRNADRVAILDARYCITCHTEHQPEHTQAMGLTVPGDYCYLCHQNIAEDRPSHKNMDFATCADSGCHNYHDNRALYEDFLIQHGDRPALLATPTLPLRTAPPEGGKQLPALSTSQADADEALRRPDIVTEWHASAHARQGVNCKDCHQQNDRPTWLDKPGPAECGTCHQFQLEGFRSGKHGMRLAANLPAIKPMDSRALAFKPASMDTGHGCGTCHGQHDFDTQTAAVQACLTCHNDQHSLAYEQSPHGRLWAREQAGAIAHGRGVSCATCHLPREVHGDPEQPQTRVQHNQNVNLRPNEKMIRGVCMHCHGLGFAIDALADPILIQNNFNGQPGVQVPSIHMARERAGHALSQQAETID